MANRSGHVSIAIIYDNNPYKKGLETAWGFSCLIKGPAKTILFDTGGDGSLLLRNMKVLGLDQKEIDFVFLSHIHKDHVGGLWHIIERNPKVIVYIPESFPDRFKKDVKGRGIKLVCCPINTFILCVIPAEAGIQNQSPWIPVYTGMTKKIMYRSVRDSTLVEVQRTMKMCEGVYSTGKLGTDIKEQSLIIHERGLIVITGCAHPGLVNVVKKVKDLFRRDIFLLIGGFHLGGKSKDELEIIVSILKKAGVHSIGPCHCTGDTAREVLQEEYQKNFINVGVGRVIK